MKKPSDDPWFVYMLRCADGSLYTGIAKDVKRRSQQHNDGSDQGNDTARQAGADSLEEEGRMIPLHHDPHFTFRFAESRIIPRIHLEGVEAGRRVSVYKIDPGTGERLGLLATAAVGHGGWVDLPEPIIVQGGEAFIAVPETSPR